MEKQMLKVCRFTWSLMASQNGIFAVVKNNYGDM